MQVFALKRCLRTRMKPSTRVPAQRKRVRVINNVPAQKRRMINNHKTMMKNNGKDQFNQLPDEVLVTILSLLPMKEAARTSVLSYRWCKLWTFIPNLNFDALHSMKPRIVTKEMRQKYIVWVNSVLKVHQRTTIDEFVVRYDLDAHNSCDIDSWVKFAFEKKVQSLTMHFPSIASSRALYQYPFPALCDNTKQLFSNYIVSLRKLDLKSVDISGDLIQHLISTCTLLEELAIIGSHSQHLVHINIGGPSICLKHLKIVSCSYVKSIYLSASSLSSFEYEGEVIDINYANVPNLVDVSLGGKYLRDYIIHNFVRLSNHVMRLETLTLRVHGVEIRDMVLVDYPELPYLKNLKIDIHAMDNESILLFASLIKAAPSLHKLEFELFWDKTFMFSFDRHVQKLSKSPHQCLKDVEFLGFRGETIDMEVLIYVLENAIALERVTLNPQSAWEKARGFDCTLECRERAMKQARCLKSKFFLGKKLVFM